MVRKIHDVRDDRWQKNLLADLSKALESDSSLVRRAKEQLDRSLSEDQGMAARDLSERRDILETYSVQRLTQFLTSSSERANRLRQGNPFLAVITPEERAKLTADLKDQNDT